MKKMSAISMALVGAMIFTIVFVPAAGAAESFTGYKNGEYSDVSWAYGFTKVEGEFEASSPDEAAAYQWKRDYIISRGYNCSEELEVSYYGTLSDGSILVFINDPDLFYSDLIESYTVGNYLYQVGNSGGGVKVYKNGKFYTIKDAYESGIIDDAALNETAIALNTTDLKKINIFYSFNSDESREKYEALLENGADVSVDAENADDLTLVEGEFDMTAVGSEIIDLIRSDYISENGFENYISVDDVSYEYYGTLSDGSILVRNCFYYWDVEAPIVDYYVIEDYLYTVNNIGTDAKVYKDGQFYTVLDAYENGIITEEILDEAAVALNFEVFNYDIYDGDVNTDSIVDVNDATYLQMYLAGYINSDGSALIDTDNSIMLSTADFNGDGTIDIGDATSIQKYLAGYKEY